MTSFSEFLRAQETQDFKKMYSAEISGIEKTYLTAKKAYEKSLRQFIKKHINHKSYQSLCRDAYEFTSKNLILSSEPDQINVLKNLIRLHELHIQNNSFDWNNYDEI